MVDFPLANYVSFRVTVDMKNIPNLNLDILHTTWDRGREGGNGLNKNPKQVFFRRWLASCFGLYVFGKTHGTPLKGLITKMNQSGCVRFCVRSFHVILTWEKSIDMMMSCQEENLRSSDASNNFTKTNWQGDILQMVWTSFIQMYITTPCFSKNLQDCFWFHWVRNLHHSRAAIQVSTALHPSDALPSATGIRFFGFFGREWFPAQQVRPLTVC